MWHRIIILLWLDSAIFCYLIHFNRNLLINFIVNIVHTREQNKKVS